MDELKKEQDKVTPKYIPRCSKHPNCCYVEGCPAEYRYYPGTKLETFKKCGC